MRRSHGGIRRSSDQRGARSGSGPPSMSSAAAAGALDEDRVALAHVEHGDARDARRSCGDDGSGHEDRDGESERGRSGQRPDAPSTGLTARRLGPVRHGRRRLERRLAPGGPPAGVVAEPTAAPHDKAARDAAAVTASSGGSSATLANGRRRAPATIETVIRKITQAGAARTAPMPDGAARRTTSDPAASATNPAAIAGATSGTTRG